MGRPRKPTRLKLLEGEWREERLNRDEPLPAPAEVDLSVPPRGIGAKAGKVWRELAPDLMDKGCLTSWDVPLFTALCATLVHYQALEAKIRRDGYTGVGSCDQPVKSVYWSARNDALKQLLALAARFGLTPADRAGLVVGVGAEAPKLLGPERLLS